VEITTKKAAEKLLLRLPKSIEELFIRWNYAKDNWKSYNNSSLKPYTLKMNIKKIDLAASDAY
jgi:hypothetical protein